MKATIQAVIFFLILFGSACKTKQWHVADVQSTNYRFDKKAQSMSGSSIDSVITPYRASLSIEMNEQIGFSEIDLFMDRPESNLGNWAADVLKRHAERLAGREIDFAILNYGGFRIKDIPKGPISRGKIYELMPFDNLLVVVELDENSLQKLLDSIAAYGGWPVSQGIQFKIKDKIATGIKLDRKGQDRTNSYSVAMPDYIANGGDNLFFLKDLPKENLKVLVRDLLILGVEEKAAVGEGITGIISNRIVQ